MAPMRRSEEPVVRRRNAAGGTIRMAGTWVPGRTIKTGPPKAHYSDPRNRDLRAFGLFFDMSSFYQVGRIARDFLDWSGTMQFGLMLRPSTYFSMRFNVAPTFAVLKRVDGTNDVIGADVMVSGETRFHIPIPMLFGADTHIWLSFVVGGTFFTFNYTEPGSSYELSAELRRIVVGIGIGQEIQVSRGVGLGIYIKAFKVVQDQLCDESGDCRAPGTGDYPNTGVQLHTSFIFMTGISMTFNLAPW